MTETETTEHSHGIADEIAEGTDGDARATRQAEAPSPVAINEAYPKTWWAIALSSDVRVGKVIPARLFERDVVLWRDSSGLLLCMAAHCPHLGANLGIGGEVFGDQLQCPFHGWRYNGDGCLISVSGPGRPRRGVHTKTYRVIERVGVIFLWNGDGEPDIEFPDFAQKLGVAEKDLFPYHHRMLLPVPARMFAENGADGVHFAFTHDYGGWMDAQIVEQTPTFIHFRHDWYDKRKWFSWENLRRRIVKGELGNMVAPLMGSPSIVTWGGAISMALLDGRKRGLVGSAIATNTPVEADSHYLFVVVLLRRLPVPILGPIANRVIGRLVSLANWTVARQDVALMIHRKEPANPPYSRDDKALIAFRRLWDSRIVTDAVLDGEDPRYCGRRAGINVPRAESP